MTTHVLLSSHAVTDLATICDYASFVRVAGSFAASSNTCSVSIDSSLARLARCQQRFDGATVISFDHRRTPNHDARARRSNHHKSSWRFFEPNLDEIVLAYLRAERSAAQPQH